MKFYVCDDGGLGFNIDGQLFVVPNRIVQQGDDAVRQYAENIEKKANAKKVKKKKLREKWGKNPDFPVQTNFDGKELSGKIISALDGLLTVRLEEPYQGETYTNFNCFGSAMAGHYIFEEDGMFSDYAISAAKRLLISIYKEAKNKPMHDMARRLSDG